MRNKTIKRCKELLEEIKFLSSNRLIHNNINYMIEALNIELAQNKFRAQAVRTSTLNRKEKK